MYCTLYILTNLTKLKWSVENSINPWRAVILKSQVYPVWVDFNKGNSEMCIASASLDRLISLKFYVMTMVSNHLHQFCSLR